MRGGGCSGIFSAHGAVEGRGCEDMESSGGAGWILDMAVWGMVLCIIVHVCDYDFIVDCPSQGCTGAVWFGLGI